MKTTTTKLLYGLSVCKRFYQLKETLIFFYFVHTDILFFRLISVAFVTWCWSAKVISECPNRVMTKLVWPLLMEAELSAIYDNFCLFNYLYTHRLIHRCVCTGCVVFELDE